MKWSLRVASCLAMTGILAVPCAAGDKVRTDIHGDPLPAGAIARLGSGRFVHGSSVQAIVYSPDGKLLASAGAEKVIKLWDADTGKTVRVLEGHQSTIRALAFVPAGEGKPAKILVSASYDKTIRFWDLATGKELQHIINHPGAATALAVSRDGKFIASGGAPETHVFLWRVEDGKEVRRWKAHVGGVTGLSFSANGKTIASSGLAKRQSFPAKADDPTDDYAAALWDVETGKQQHLLDGHKDIAWTILFSADGKRLLSSGIDNKRGRSMILWDPDTGKQIRTLGKRSFIDARTMAYSPDGKTIAAADFGRIMLFDAESGAEQRGMQGNAIMDRVQTLAFSPDGQTLVTAGEKGRLALWDVARRGVKGEVKGHTQPLTSVAVSPDGKYIATTCEDGSAFLWDRATSKTIHLLRNQKVPGVAVIWCAAFSPDSRLVALSHQRDGISIWDVNTGQLERHIKEKNSDRIVSVAFSPDGKHLASESIDQPYASLWDTGNGDLVRKFERGVKRFAERGTCVAISPDGRLLASTASNGLNVWETDTGKRVLLKPAGGSTVAFSPGGFLLAVAGHGVRILDAQSGEELSNFEANLHHYGWRGIAFSRDGRMLAVADTKRVILWDVAERRLLRGLAGHSGIITSVAFTPEGKAVVSAAEDGTALVWDLEGLMPAEKKGDAKTLWNELYDKDRLRAYAAFCRLRAFPEDAMAMIKSNLKPAKAADAERVADLIKKLDSPTFAVRDQAEKELKKLGMAAEEALVTAQKSRSLETKRRITELLAHLDTSEDWQRTQTALKLLEELPAASTRELLQSLAKGDSQVRLTREAEAILQRIGKRLP
jgi:WD40 repeat protein